jgi:hypothetical protein
MPPQIIANVCKKTPLGALTGFNYPTETLGCPNWKVRFSGNIIFVFPAQKTVSLLKRNCRIFLNLKNRVMANNENEQENEMNMQEGGRLTVAKLRTFPGCEHYSDEEAEKIVQSLRRLSEIILNIPVVKNYLIDNQ